MRCPHCGLENVDAHSTCPTCKEPLRATRRAADHDPIFDRTGGIAVGRVRPVTLEEDQQRETFFRADAVLAAVPSLPADLSVFETHVAGLIDGVRPVARVRKKAGVSSADLRIALGGLVDRKLIRVVGIIEEAVGVFAADIAHDLVTTQSTVARAAADVIPPHVMAEIQAMLDEGAVGNAMDDIGDDDAVTDAFTVGGDPPTEA